MKAVVAAFNQEKALVGAFSVITKLRMELFQALVVTRTQTGEGRKPIRLIGITGIVQQFESVLRESSRLLSDVNQDDDENNHERGHPGQNVLQQPRVFFFTSKIFIRYERSGENIKLDKYLEVS